MPSASQIIPQPQVVSLRARMYTPLPYFLSTFLVTLPLELLPGIVYGTVIYYMTELREGAQYYLTYLGVMLLENFAGIGLGMCLSASFTNVEMAPQLAPAFVILFLMFSGFFLNENNVPIFHLAQGAELHPVRSRLSGTSSKTPSFVRQRVDADVHRMERTPRQAQLRRRHDLGTASSSS